MTVWDSIILGIVEGFTEFLPISSTGHMIAVSEFLGLKQNNINMAFEVIIQFAAILAVILTYPSKFTFKHIDLWTKVMIAFLPIAALGFIFSKQVKELFSIEIVAIMFIIGGIVFLIVERFYKEEGIFRLQPENDALEPIIVRDLQIMGKVIGVFRFFA